MKSRVVLTIALLCAFALGLASFHPIANAMEQFAAGTCSSAKPCVAATNLAKGQGFSGSSAFGTGVRGITTNATTTHPEQGVLGWDRSAVTTNAGVYGRSNMGTAVLGESQTGAAIIGATNGSIGIAGYTGSTAASSVALAAEAPNGADLFLAEGAGDSSVTIDGAANVTTTGQIFTSGACSSGCIVHRRVRSYGTTAAAPTMEDTGESLLSGGAAYVRLDPAFANAIDPREGYYVLVTPEGETRGLFVARRTPAGFFVRETMGGRSNLAFAYRIVAHPYGVREARLPFVQMPVRTASPVARTAP
jgi:hypothetical protein